MNPLDHDRFWRLWEDVDGLLDFTVGPLAGALSHHLPDYVTVLQHGGSRRRPLDVDLVAIPLFEILRVRKDGSYGPRFRSAQELRHYFKLGASTKLLFTGVDDDRRIERFWFEHKVNKVAEEIAALDPIGVTTPNFFVLHRCYQVSDSAESEADTLGGRILFGRGRASGSAS